MEALSSVNQPPVESGHCNGFSGECCSQTQDSSGESVAAVSCSLNSSVAPAD